MKCPCGQPLEVITVMNLSLHCEAEIVTCLCGRIRERFIDDMQRAKFIQLTHKLMGKRIPLSHKLKETSTDKFKALSDSL